VGDLYEATCSDCDYRARRLPAGSGLRGTSFYPMVCNSCRELVSVALAGAYGTGGLTSVSVACPHCGGDDLTPLPNLDLTMIAPAEKLRVPSDVPCPQCGGLLTLAYKGTWT
jgi:hypothetical protein